MKFRELDEKREQLGLSVIVAQIIAEKVTYEQTQVQLKAVTENLDELAQVEAGLEDQLVDLKQKRREVERTQETLHSCCFNFNDS